MTSITAHIALHNMWVHLEGRTLTQPMKCATRKKGSLISEYQISLLISVASWSTLIENGYQPFLVHLDEGERKRFYVRAAEQKTAQINHSFMNKIRPLL